jgi:Cdc6-like AAA superfamily ATPase
MSNTMPDLASIYKACLINKRMRDNIAQVTQDLVDSEEFIQDITAGVHRSALVFGPPGMGKTHLVESGLKRAGKVLGEDYIIARSHITPRQLYAMLYCMRGQGQYVIIDDCDAVMSDEDGLNILKAATDNTFRTVGWASSKAGVKLPNGEEVPSEFEFNGTVIIATNVRQASKGKTAQHFAALRSRCVSWQMNYDSKEEQFAYIFHLIVDKKYLCASEETKLTWAQKIDLLKFIMSNLSQVERLDLRKPQHIARVMKAKPNNWQNHALKFLKEGV